MSTGVFFPYNQRMGTKEMHQIIQEEKPIRAVSVGLQTRQTDEEFARAMEELALLAKTCHMEAVATSTQKATHPVQATYVGSV